MDSDLNKHRKQKGNELLVFPDSDISEPGTESESESEAAAVDTESTDDSLDEDDLPLANFLEETDTENTEDNIPIAVMAPHLCPIKFQWQ